MDKELLKILKKEEEYHQNSLNFIASENYPSKAVRDALSSIFVSRYSEGRPGKRYYGGMKHIDELEILVEKRVRRIFGLDEKKWSVNVQPYSGSPANYAVLRALLKLGDKIMGLDISHGGHLTHGSPASLSGIDFKNIPYFVEKESGLIDYEKVEKIALKEKPKLIIAGYSAYPRKVNFRKFGEIARAVGAYLMADIAHIAGLIVAGVHPNPFPWADVVTTTTHKTLRGPRGAIIICRKKLAEKIFKIVFPGLQGGPHNQTIFAIGVALKEASTPSFRNYARQIVKNAKALAERLKEYNFNLLSGGTDTHLFLIDLKNKKITGQQAQDLLEEGGIIVNKNVIPYETRSAFDPSGIRLGTPAVTTRGLKEKEMKLVAEWINEIISNPKSRFKIKNQVRKLCKKFPIPS